MKQSAIQLPIPKSIMLHSDGATETMATSTQRNAIMRRYTTYTWMSWHTELK